MKTHVLLSVLVVVATPDLAAPERQRAVLIDTPREISRRAAVSHGGQPLKGTVRTTPASRFLSADEEKKEAKKSGTAEGKKEKKETGPAVKIKETKKEGPLEKEAEKTEKSSKKSKSTKKSTKKSKSDGVEGATIPPLMTNIFNMVTGSPTMALVPSPITPPTPNATVQTARSGCVLHVDSSARGNSTAGPSTGKEATLPADINCNSAMVIGTTLAALVVSCALVFA